MDASGDLTAVADTSSPVASGFADITTSGSRVTCVATNVTAADAQANLLSNGYSIVKQTMGSNGPVTILSNGQNVYTIYTATSTGASSLQLSAGGPALLKVRLGYY